MINKGKAIINGIFKPTPIKAPPPKYLKLGDEIVEIKPEYPSINLAETLFDTGLYVFIIDNLGSGLNVQVNYSHPQYEIESIVLSQYDILYDAVDLNSTPIENKLVIIKLKPIGNNPPNNTAIFTLPTNPTRLSIAPMINVPISIFEEVKENHISFHIYPFF